MRRAAGLLAGLVLGLAPACSATQTTPVSETTAGPAFTRVALPAGDRPEVITADGNALLVGVHRATGPQTPGLLRIRADGHVTEVPATAASGYGAMATWYSLAARDGQVLAVGGDRGGAHGNVRWSVWTGTTAGVAEHLQAFSTFGGWGAGDLVDGVLTPAGPTLVGSWQSDATGLDVATWTARADTWTRRPSAGTALASTPSDLGFPIRATATGAGVLVAGWALPLTRTGAATPTVWWSTSGADGWRRSSLPAAGPGTASNARCAGTTCAAVGRVGGVLALWRSDGPGAWTEVVATPRVPLAEDAVLAAPLVGPGGVDEPVSEGGRVEIVHVDGTGVTTRPVDGPTGEVTAAVATSTTTYLLAGRGPDELALWQGPNR